MSIPTRTRAAHPVMAGILVIVLGAGRALALPPPNVALQSVAAGGGLSVGGAIRLNATVGQVLAGTAVGGGDAVAAGFWGPPPEDNDWTVCGVTQSASILFNTTYRPRIGIPVVGTLDCIQVKRTDAAHPDSIPGIDGGRYWALTGTDSSGGTAASFAVSLTFPQPGFGDPHVCRSLGGGTWDCVQSSFTGSDVTRDGVTLLSDWAVADHFVVPVELLWFTVE